MAFTDYLRQAKAKALASGERICDCTPCFYLEIVNFKFGDWLKYKLDYHWHPHPMVCSFFTYCVIAKYLRSIFGRRVWLSMWLTNSRVLIDLKWLLVSRCNICLVSCIVSIDALFPAFQSTLFQILRLQLHAWRLVRHLLHGRESWLRVGIVFGFGTCVHSLLS